jgi:hypothetical protein
MIVAILMLSVAFAAVPAARAATALSVNCESKQGSVGTEVTVTVSGTTPGGLVRLYWDTVANLLAEGYAVGTTATFTIVVPAAVQGDHYVIAKDVESGATSYDIFTVDPAIELIPEKVLPGDTVTISGTGFAGSTSVVVLYTPTNSTSTSEFVGIGDGSRRVFYLANKPVRSGETITNWTDETSVSTEPVTLNTSGAPTYTGTLENAPVKPGSLTLTVSNGTNNYNITDDGNGALTSTTLNITASSIDYATGEFSFTLGGTPPELVGATADYTYYAASNPAIGYTIDYVAGVITFATAPASGVAITANYKYYSADLQVSASTNNVGNFTASLRVPTTEVSGSKTIIALDSKGNEANNFLTVVYTLITLSPEEGYVGTTVTVTGRGFTAGKTVDILWYMSPTTSGSYITVVDNYPVAADGTFTATFNVPAVPDPTAPGNDYSVKAIDSVGKSDSTTFKVVAPAKITLSPTSGKAGDTVTITGSWFTANTEVTFTFNGAPLTTIPSPVYTDGTGAFTADFKVPDVAAGTYTVEATDAKGVSATATFKVTVPVTVIQTRASEYMPGDTISIYANCSEPYDAYIEINDTNGVLFWSGWVDDSSWTEIDGWYVLPYTAALSNIPLSMMMIPSDAPLGSWNFTAYKATVTTHSGGGFDISCDKTKILDTNTFTVVAKPSLHDVLASLSDINAKIVAIDGNVATISTKVGEVNASLSSIVTAIESVGNDVVQINTALGTINGTITAINGNVATIQTDVGTIKADVSTIKGYFPVTIDMTPIWIAVIMSLIAAIAAIAAVVQISRKIAG